jgi:hypothetical protein
MPPAAATCGHSSGPCSVSSPAPETGQPQVTAYLTRILPEIAAWAAALPSGILALEPWLTREAASVTFVGLEPT